MILDSIDNVIKNQKIPNAITLCFLKIKNAKIINDDRNRKLSIVLGSKKLFDK
jgi:hypothetical protein